MNTCESCEHDRERGDNACNMGVSISKFTPSYFVENCKNEPFGCTLWEAVPKPIVFVGTVGLAKNYCGDALVICPYLGAGEELRDGKRVKVTLEPTK